MSRAVKPPPPGLRELVPDPQHLAGRYGEAVTVARLQLTGRDFERQFIGVDELGRLWRLSEPRSAFAPWTLTLARPAEPEGT